MRMYGIGNNAIYRSCIKNHQLGDIKIKKGTRLTFSMTALNYDAEFHKDPYKFDINRFTKENIKAMPKKVFMPFYEGTRMCSGIYLGQVMTKSVLLSILTQFEVERDPDFDAKWLHTMTLEMPSVKLRMRPRKL